MVKFEHYDLPESKPVSDYRVTIKLTDDERRERRRLRPIIGEAFSFWHKVAYSRGLDYSTIIYEDGYYFALPLDHDKHWCWPHDLKCRKRIKYVEE